VLINVGQKPESGHSIEILTHADLFDPVTLAFDLDLQNEWRCRGRQVVTIYNFGSYAAHRSIVKIASCWLNNLSVQHLLFLMSYRYVNVYAC